MVEHPQHESIIAAVQTPLGFFTLVVLVIEGALIGLALALNGNNQTIIVWAIPIILIMLILVVALIAWFKPEALWGRRYSALETQVAESLGVEMFNALEGYMSNLEPDARSESYEFLRGRIMTSTYGKNSETQAFCAALGDMIVNLAVAQDGYRKRYKQGVLRMPPSSADRTV